MAGNGRKWDLFLVKSHDEWTLLTKESQNFLHIRELRYFEKCYSGCLNLGGNSIFVRKFVFCS